MEDKCNHRYNGKCCIKCGHKMPSNKRMTRKETRELEAEAIDCIIRKLKLSDLYGRL